MVEYGFTGLAAIWLQGDNEPLQVIVLSWTQLNGTVIATTDMGDFNQSGLMHC